MNPLTLVTSALGAVGSAIVGTPSNATSGIGDYGNETVSGAPISSGGGQSTGISITSLLVLGGLAIGGLFLWKHFMKK